MAMDRYSVFEYRYRDGGNFKTHGRLLLTGQSPEAEQVVRKCLEWGDQFVAEQVGIPSLCFEHWESVDDGPSDLDHAYHEFVGLRSAEKEDSVIAVWGSLESMVSRMQHAAGKWDVTLSPNWDL